MAFTVVLKQGASTIKSEVVSLTGSLADYSVDLTTGERNSISDWTALTLSLVADGTQVKITRARVKTPKPKILAFPPELLARKLAGDVLLRM